MTKPRIINCGQAINEGLIEAGIKNDSVIYLAEGVDDPSAVYGTLSGLSNHFAASRIIEMPLSENALTGIAIGAALMGKRPVLSFHRVEFALLAMEQIVNNAKQQVIGAVLGIIGKLKNEIEETIRKYGIDCDWQRTGELRVAVKDWQLDGMKEEAELRREIEEEKK